MSEGSLEAPTRHVIDWQNPDFTDVEKLDAEMRRIFDICHGCRRCFNLCDSFPQLFDLIDESESMELDTVDSKDFKPVVDACTLCDMCFLTKCPYVPPHEFNLDFPHLMLRYRHAELKRGERPMAEGQLTRADRNGKLGTAMAPLANWASRTGNRLSRTVLDKALHIHPEADLPVYAGKTFEKQAAASAATVDTAALASGRKALIYATCFVNYNDTAVGEAARAILSRNGVETEVVYPTCCGMPQLEQGDIASVAERAARVAAELRPQIDAGYDVVALTPSCALMLKFEWPLIVPDNEDVKALSAVTRDVTEYVVEIAREYGLAEGMQPLDGGVTLHMACHSRAQNIGQKAAEMLRLIPDADVSVIERCSGHGGCWGFMRDNFDTAIKVGRPVARQAAKAVSESSAEGKTRYVSSECPLAASHIAQGIRKIDESVEIAESPHPVVLLARAYGLPV